MLDRIFADPDAIVAAVAAAGRFAPAGGSAGYPGVQCTAPPAYRDALLAAARPALARIFGFDDGAIGDLRCLLSLVTHKPAELHPLQTVPHVDRAEPDRFALLHFLCRPPFGGTAFFRQDATGLEQLGRADWPAYVAARDPALAGTPGRYPDGETPGYTLTATVPAAFDRLLVYRSHTLHSGLIPDDVDHPPDPRRGRLTGNLFGLYRPG